jgi:uncharacterized membrane protein YeiH
MGYLLGKLFGVITLAAVVALGGGTIIVGLALLACELLKWR